jgi:transposase
MRVIKVQQKILGAFHSKSEANILCWIRGSISTLRKQDLSVLENLRFAIEGKSFLQNPSNA